MAKLKITPKTTVAELKKQFLAEVGGGVLRVYDGRSEAKDDATLASIGAKEGETAEFRTSRTVGKFEEAVQQELNLKVKVYTNDNWVKVLDGITLAVAAKLPNGMTKAKMEEYLSYQRSEKEDADSNAANNDEVLKQYENVLLIDVEIKKIELPENPSEYSDYAADLMGNNDNGISVVFHGRPNGDKYAAVDTNFRDYDYLMEDAKNMIDNEIPDDEDSDIYISSNVTVYDVEEYDPYVEDYGDIIGIALNEYCDGGNKHRVDYSWEDSFRNGRAVIRLNFDGNVSIFEVHANGSIDFINLSEEQFYLISRAITEKACGGDEPITEYKYHGKFGFIDKQLNLVVEPQFDSVSYRQDFYTVVVNGKTGVINRDGVVVVAPVFENVKYGDVWAVQVNDKWGFFDKNELKYVVEPKYDEAFGIYKDAARVKLDGKWGIVNAKMEYTIPPTYANLQDFSEGLAGAQLEPDGLWGYINPQMEFVIKAQYDRVEGFYNGEAKVVINGDKFVIDTAGNVLRSIGTPKKQHWDEDDSDGEIE
jgi:hypothetical protein